MLAAVHFHHEAGFHTEEVEEVRPPRNLTLPLPSAEPASAQGKHPMESRRGGFTLVLAETGPSVRTGSDR